MPLPSSGFLALAYIFLIFFFEEFFSKPTSEFLFMLPQGLSRTFGHLRFFSTRFSAETVSSSLLLNCLKSVVIYSFFFQNLVSDATKVTMLLQIVLVLSAHIFVLSLGKSI